MGLGVVGGGGSTAAGTATAGIAGASKRSRKPAVAKSKSRGVVAGGASTLRRTAGQAGLGPTLGPSAKRYLIVCASCRD